MEFIDLKNEVEQFISSCEIDEYNSITSNFIKRDLSFRGSDLN